ncbi:MAG: superoxide dismutase family protein [Pseudomonadota bacterium]
MIRALIFAALLAVPACAQLAEPPPVHAHGQAEGTTHAGEIDILGMDGETVGSATLLQGPHGLLGRIEIGAGGLTPGWHGVHFHAVGDCSDTGVFKLSGGHVGMIEGGHGLMNPKGPEAGDLPNIYAYADGSAGMEVFTSLISLDELLEGDGSALVIHEAEDDHLSQPIGGAGARVACGVVAVVG